MSTNAEKNKRYSIDDIVKIAVSVMIAIGGGQVINTASAPNERLAVVETKVQTVEQSIPKMNEKLDTLLMRVARLQK